jgi:heterodisulfide reductase subunit C
MKDLGFSISKSRTIDLDKADLSVYQKIIDKVPSAKLCLMCGACTATCSARNHTDFNFRKIHLLFRRGQFDGLADELDKCMLCGKCRLVCNRGVNTRAIVYNMRIILDNLNYKRIK